MKWGKTTEGHDTEAHRGRLVFYTMMNEYDDDKYDSFEFSGYAFSAICEWQQEQINCAVCSLLTQEEVGRARDREQE